MLSKATKTKRSNNRDFPDRERTRKIVTFMSGRPSMIERWNGFRRRFLPWVPNLSDTYDPFKFQKEYPECADLQDADLSNANLEAAHLEGAELMFANLEGANLNDAHLEGAGLSHAKLKGVNLIAAHLEDADLMFADLMCAKLKSADLSSAYLDDVNMRKAHLEGAKLWKAHLEDADLSSAHLEGADLSRAYLEGANMRSADFSDVNLFGIKYDRDKLSGKCRGIRVASCYGQALFKRDVEDQDYVDTLRETWTSPWGRVVMWLWSQIDYGRSLFKTAIIALFFALTFGIIYDSFPWLIHVNKDSVDTFLTPYYYSIVTYTTLGFGDVFPKTLAGQIVVMIEVIFGYLTLGLLISILANKVARRS